MRKSWDKYYENTKSIKPSTLLIGALESFNPRPGSAVDLGCGTGRDSRYLLERGFDVKAVDKDSGAKKYLDQLPHQDRLEFICTSFEDFAYDSYDVVNAHYSLPFSDRDSFDDVMRKIVISIKPGGLFVGQLFGIDDEWNTADTKLSFHERGDIERFFNNFESLQILEVNEDGFMANGSPKHWHVFNIIAQKSARQVTKKF